MLCLLSPSKTLNEKEKKFLEPLSKPIFSNDIAILIENLRQKSSQDFIKLMDISENLAQLNFARFQNFDVKNYNEQNSEQAIFCFKGDVYEGLDVNSLSNQEISVAFKKIAILSGLYGLILPSDLVQPYRLEMGTKLANIKGKDLYEFWGEKITEKLNDIEQDCIVNLASNEYFKAVKPKKLKAKLINIIFKEDRNNKVSVIAIFAKKARGLMARYIVKNNIEKIADLKNFNYENYYFSAKNSDENNLTFIRKH